MRTAQRIGLRTIAVDSDADRDAPHVRVADAAVAHRRRARRRFLPAHRQRSSLQRATGATAVHPGYGFLSENAAFARGGGRRRAASGSARRPRRCARWPTRPKRARRWRRSRRAGAAGLRRRGSGPGLAREAARIGFPLMIKAAAGGGGRGMRLVRDAGELDATRSTRRSAEAPASFGDARLLLERALLGAAPRRDPGLRRQRTATAIHLGERDCSVQRRHQKLIEEAPSPAVVAGAARGAWARPRSRRRARSATSAPARSSSCSSRRQVLVHGDEHAAAGRASGDRGAASASTWSNGSCASPPARRCR